MPLSFSFPAKVSILPSSFSQEPRSRNLSFPLAHSSRKKDRRWPLVIRFWKGSIHSTIAFPVFAHATLAAVVVYINQQITSNFSLPSSIIPSISIVVGLMLVFRNQVAWTRYWGGRNHLNTVTTAIRCLTRQFLVLTPAPRPALRSSPSESMLFPRSRNVSMSAESTVVEDKDYDFISDDEEIKTVETIKILIAMLYTIKNHLRTEWGVALSPGTSLTRDGQETIRSEYQDLLPQGLKGYEHRGLGLTLELATFIEKFIAIGVKKTWFHNAASSAMLSHLDALTSAYGSMEVIRLVPIPVAHLIHHKQTLALFCGILPFAMAAEIGVWAVPLTAFVSFTLYGIEGIAASYEDPFGRTPKTDINVDDIVEDARQEIEVLLDAWRNQGKVGDKEGLFWGRRGGKSRANSVTGIDANGDRGGRSGVKFVISDLNPDIHEEDSDNGLAEGEVVIYRDDVGEENERRSRDSRRKRITSAVSPMSRGPVGKKGSSEDYFSGI